MEIAGYFAIVRRWWLVSVASVVLAAAGGYAVVSQLPKVYEAEVRVLVGPLNTDLNTQRAAGQLAQTYAQLVTSQRVTEAVIRRLGVDIQPSQLQNSMTAIPNDVTRLVIIRVESGDPELAAQLANAAAEELAILGAATARPEGQTQVIDRAEAPTSPAAPQVSLLVMLAALAGLLAAISCIVLIEYFRDSVSSQEELRELTDAPILGAVPTRWGRRRDVASALLGSNSADRYRLLTARIEPALGTNPVRTLLVTGIQPDGRAGIAGMGLALGFADRGIQTALVDANMLHPEATQALGLRPVAGLDKLIAGGQVPISRLNLVAGGNRSQSPRYVDLTVVPSGSGRDLGRSQYLEVILDRLAASAEVVVITAPPVDRSPEALMWARLVDAIVLVVPYPSARRRDLASSMEALRLTGLKIAGTVLVEALTPARLSLRLPRRKGSEPLHAASTSSVAREILAPRPATLRSGTRPGPQAMRASGDPDA